MPIRATRPGGRPPERLPRTLVIHGDMDPKTPLEGAKAHVVLLRDAGPVRLTTVAGAPHFVAFVAGDCFVDAVKAFVTGASPASGL